MSLILHHYPMSPFSEKIRSMLGFAGLEWQSCLTEEAPPRTPLMTLSGGYNRIPIAQLGADIFCDSNLIAREIAQTSGKPDLSPESLTTQESETLAFYESKLFFACINKAFSVRLLGRIAREKGVFNLLGFLKDRIQMSRTATISMGSPRSAPRIINAALVEVAETLSGRPYLNGSQPGLLDFALYHGLWFVKFVGRQEFGVNDSVLNQWYDQLYAFTRSPSTEISVEQAIQIAQVNQPRALPESMKQDECVGQPVSISTSDYRQFPIEGTLAGSDDYSWVLQRQLASGSNVHVHFPKRGYLLEPQR